jgi:two-component system response regulator CpxR
MQLLLIDDDHELADLIEKYLGEHGFEVSVCHDGRQGLARAFDTGIHMILLDGMLPGLDGIEVLRQLRRRSNVAVIMLTARSSKQDRINGLDSGADDYLAKPFAPEELLARIRAVLRRTQQAGARNEVLVLGKLKLDPSQREAWLEEDCCHLTSLQFEILEHLMRNCGRAISRDELTSLLHQRESTPFERWLDVHISQLRKKIEADREVRIRTLRGVGYMFTPPKAVVQ